MHTFPKLLEVILHWRASNHDGLLRCPILISWIRCISSCMGRNASIKSQTLTLRLAAISASLSKGSIKTGLQLGSGVACRRRYDSCLEKSNAPTFSVPSNSSSSSQLWIALVHHTLYPWKPSQNLNQLPATLFSL